MHAKLLARKCTGRFTSAYQQQSWHKMVRTGIHQANGTEERVGEGKPVLAALRLAFANQAEFMEDDEPPA